MSSIFGQTANFGQRACLFHISNIGIKNKLTKRTVKILMRRLIRSRLIWISTVCKCVSEYPTLPYLVSHGVIVLSVKSVKCEGASLRLFHLFVKE